ncbi:MAG: hypothetical protein OJI67_23445 [Prosthecobacter sp.]|nr:hypothetical protein [Prosthecobacter sp.]
MDGCFVFAQIGLEAFGNTLTLIWMIQSGLLSMPNHLNHILPT